MKIIIPISLFLFASAVSCSGEKSKSSTTVVKKTSIVVKTNQVKADKLLSVDIEGMVCEKGCGSSIRKELLHTNAVESCEFDYQSDRKTNIVKIAFDTEKITVDKLLAILNAMNEKQFTVGKTSTENFESKKTTSSNTSNDVNFKERKMNTGKDEASIEVSDSTLDHDTPNLLQLFSRLITG